MRIEHDTTKMAVHLRSLHNEKWREDERIFHLLKARLLMRTQRPTRDSDFRKHLSDAKLTKTNHIIHSSKSN